MGRLECEWNEWRWNISWFDGCFNSAIMVYSGKGTGYFIILIFLMKRGWGEAGRELNHRAWHQPFGNANFFVTLCWYLWQSLLSMFEFTTHSQHMWWDQVAGNQPTTRHDQSNNRYHTSFNPIYEINDSASNGNNILLSSSASFDANNASDATTSKTSGRISAEKFRNIETIIVITFLANVTASTAQKGL